MNRLRTKGRLNQRTKKKKKKKNRVRGGGTVETVPELQLNTSKKSATDGWRRLKQSHIPVGFITKVHTPKCEGPKDLPGENASSVVGMVDPAKGASHDQPLNLIPTTTFFILDVMADTEKYREKGGGLALGKEESDKKLSEADKKVENEALAISFVKNGKLQELEEILDEVGQRLLFLFVYTCAHACAERSQVTSPLLNFYTLPRL